MFAGCLLCVRIYNIHIYFYLTYIVVRCTVFFCKLIHSDGTTWYFHVNCNQVEDLHSDGTTWYFHVNCNQVFRENLHLPPRLWTIQIQTHITYIEIAPQSTASAASACLGLPDQVNFIEFSYSPKLTKISTSNHTYLH